MCLRLPGFGSCSLSSRCSSTSTLCGTVVDVNPPCPPNNLDNPPPLPPRMRRRESSHGCPETPVFISAPSVFPTAPSVASSSSSSSSAAATDSLPPLPPRESHGHQSPPPLPPRRLTSQDHAGQIPYRRTTTNFLPRTMRGNDDGLPQLPPKTYRHSHVRQSST
jgi:hypothetical protein